MNLMVTSQGGQASLNTSATNEIHKSTDNMEVFKSVNNKDYSEKDIAKAVKEINKLLKHENTYAEYSIHEKLGDTIIKIIDKDTKEIILECPPEKILDLVAKLCELSGVAIDKKA